MTLQPFVEIAACRKTYFPQIVLLQDKEKPYFGFQKLGCHCKNLRCHFDTQKRLKKHFLELHPHTTLFDTPQWRIS